MLKLIPINKTLKFYRNNIRGENNKIIKKVYFFIRSIFAKYLGLYPFSNGREIFSVLSVVYSGNWNSAYSKVSKVSETEKQFCKYLNVSHSILVPSGGVAIEILMRILKESNKNVFCHHIRHTCPAQPFSILRSGVIPLPCNQGINPFSLPREIYQNSSKENLVLPTHYWGYPENLNDISKDHTIEDCCLSFDSYQPNGAHVGTQGIAGIFSFGYLKPIQSGEGGLICTNNTSLANEIRTMQNYGINDSKDVKSFGLNGRISCIQAAIISEQLKTYKKYINLIRNGVYKLKNEISNLNLPIDVFIPDGYKIEQLGFSAILLKINSNLNYKVRQELENNGVETLDAFFQDILSLTYFKKDIIKVLSIDQQKIYKENFLKNENYSYPQEYIAIPRKWIVNKFMRSYLKNVIIKSFKKIT